MENLSMKTFEEIFGHPINYSYNDRADFSKISGQLPLPYLCEIQTESFQWLTTTGIDEVLKDFFPIKSSDETMELGYVSLSFGEPEHDYFDCKSSNLTYSAPLHVVLQLKNKNDGTIKEGTIFMGDFPMMTDSGTFIINGVEKVVESQIVRSSGAYMHKEEVATSATFTYGADIIPARGTWLEFLSDAKNMLYVRIDKQKKVPAPTLLRALGIVHDEEIYRIFGTSNPMLQKTMEKYPEPTDVGGNPEEAISIMALKEIYSKLRPGEPVDEKDVAAQIKSRFFKHRNYDLGPAGRYKLNVKLGAYDRIYKHYVAEDLVSVDGEVVVGKDTYIDKAILDQLKEEKFFEKGAHQYEFPYNEGLDNHNKCTLVDIYADDEKTKVERIVGNDMTITDEYVTPSDIVACFSYFLNIIDGVGNIDDIDHLGNRRIRSVGELIQNQFRTGLSRMERIISDKMSVSKEMANVQPDNLINIKPLTSCIREFFNSSQLSQFMDQTNPLSELSNKRRISALGPGGLTRDRASFEVRDVHYSHYGRICPIETPEGQNIGLIANLACYAKINQYGFIETPYRRVVNKVVSDQADYLSADAERSHTIAQANVKLDPKTHAILDERVLARQNGETVMAKAEEVDYIDVSPKQIVSIASACIPFLENDDSTRAQMGGNMQRQALPLLRPHAPYVGTGLEHKIATDSGAAITARADGVVTYVDSTKIDVLEGKDKTPYSYELKKFMRSNQGTCINQNAIVNVGQQFKAGDVIADGPAMDHGELALGQNVIIAFTTWHGYNYEDAVIMSERLMKDDVYTTLHIVEYDVDRRKTKNGKEEFTADIPNVSGKAKAHLDARGIITVGSEVKEGDILVGKTSPKGDTELTPEEKLLQSIFLSKSKDLKDTSFKVPHGGGGIVLEVKFFSRKNNDDLPPNVLEDMPFLPDGTPIDILLNPLGVPSRMNIGQILEVHLGMACRKLGGLKVSTPVFDGISNEEIFKMMKAAGMDDDGKTILYSGETGERFDSRINVGVMYMIKLVHMVDDKLHARAVGPYSLVTQQPLGGKAQNGGQRFGEMEVWALEAYGAAHVLQEMLTIKSDDMVGRNECYEAILKNKPIPKPNMPESFRVLIKELQALAIDVRLYTEGMKEIDISSITSESMKEAKSTKRRIFQMGEEPANPDEANAKTGEMEAQEEEEDAKAEEQEPSIKLAADPDAE
jgi:DNA-directed RNA polymerase subunit beta